MVNMLPTDEIQNATRQPSTAISMSENATQQPILTWKLNTTEQRMVNNSRQVLLLTNKNVTELNRTDSWKLTTTKPQNTTQYPSRSLNVNVTEDHTLATTAQPPSSSRKNVTETLPTTKNPTDAWKPTTPGRQNTTMETSTILKLNVTLVNATRQPLLSSHKNVTGNSSTAESKTNSEQTTVTEAYDGTRQPTATVLTADQLITNITEQPTSSMNKSATEEAIDSKNYTFTVKPTTKEVLNTEQQFITKNINNTTIRPTTATEANTTITDKRHMPWSRWTSCSRTCGLGFKVRARLCKQNKEGLCSRNETEISLCTIGKCERMVPTWAPWEPWNECSSQCGIGIRIRIRSCRNSKVMTVTRTGCPGSRYEIEMCRSSTKCSSKGKLFHSIMEKSVLA
jgi:hypothetical protein